MSASETTRRDATDLAHLIRCYEQLARATAELEAEVRRLHPERLSEHNWRSIRAVFIDHLSITKEAHESTIQSLKAIEVDRESNHP